MQDKQVFLYSIHGGEFVVFEGVMKILPKHHRSNTTSIYVGKKRLICSVKPGIAQNEMVWLEEKDDEQARKILLDYEILRIEALQSRIKSHYRKIDGLLLKEE